MNVFFSIGFFLKLLKINTYAMQTIRLNKINLFNNLKNIKIHKHAT